MSVKRTIAGSVAKAKAVGPTRRGSGSDWARLREMTDATAEAGAARDGVNPPRRGSWLDAGQLVEPTRKRAISLCLDADVVDWFRNTGPRYQSRMNAVLRAFVQHQRETTEPRAKRNRAG